MTEKLIEALKTDPDFYQSWKANIAMAMLDAYRNAGENKDMKKIANDGADAFLKLLTGQPYPYFIS